MADEIYPLKMNETERAFWTLALNEAKDPRQFFITTRLFAGILIRLINEVEKAFGDKGHELCYKIMHQVGREVGERITEKLGLEGKADLPTILRVTRYHDLQLFNIRAEITESEDRRGTYRVTFCPIMHHPDFKARDCRIWSWYFRGILDALGVDIGFELKELVPGGGNVCEFSFFYKEDVISKDIADAIVDFLKKRTENAKLKEIFFHLKELGLVPDTNEGFGLTRIHASVLRDRNDIVLYEDGFGSPKEAA
ncbi:MAG: hypothetical protein ABID54_14025 [Pseudomonadota bacterium]